MQRCCSAETILQGSMPYKSASLHWRHNGHDSVSNHQLHDCLLNRLFRRRSKKISKLRVTGLCAGNSPETGEFPAQIASNADNVSIWWRHHVNSLSDTLYIIKQEPDYIPLIWNNFMFLCFYVMTWQHFLHHWPFVTGIGGSLNLWKG